MPTSWKTFSAQFGRALRGRASGRGAAWAALALAASLAVATDARAQGAVRDIRVEGNKRVEPETVRSYLTFAPGDAYNPAKVDASLKASVGEDRSSWNQRAWLSAAWK